MMDIVQRAITGLVVGLFALIFLLTAAKYATAGMPGRRGARIALYLAAIALTAYGCAEYARGP